MTKYHLGRRFILISAFLLVGLGTKLSDYKVENFPERDSHYLNSNYSIQKTFAPEYHTLERSLSDKEVKSFLKKLK